MDFLKTRKNLDLSINYDNNISSNNSLKYSLIDDHNIQNKYIYTEIDPKTTKSINNNGILMYKSIFRRKDGKFKNTIINEKDKINNNNSINDTHYYKVNDNNYLAIIKKSYVILRNKKQQQFTINKNNPKEDYSFVNFQKQRIVNNIKFFNSNIKNINNKKNINNSTNYQEFSLNKKRNVKYNVNTLEQAHTENGMKMEFNDINFKRIVDNNKKINLNNNIIGRNDFVQNIKEINDLNYLDDIDKKNGRYYSTTDNIKRLMKNDYNNNPNDKYETKNNIFKQISTISKSRNNNDIQSNNYKKYNIKNNGHINNDALNRRYSNLDEKYTTKLINTQKPNENKISNNNRHKDKILLNYDSFHNIPNNNVLLDNTFFSTISLKEEQIKSVPKNLSFEYNELTKKKIPSQKTSISTNRTNNFINRVGNNSIKENIPKITENKNKLNVKDQIQELNKIINEKNNKLNNCTKVINNFKGRIEILMKNNNELKEINKKNEILLNKFKKEIIILRQKRNDFSQKKYFSENNLNINYNFINRKITCEEKIKDLEEQIEKFKKENNDLKLLLMKYKNNNEDTNPKEKLLNKYNTSSFIHDNTKKKSYCVTKTKKNLSFFSSKIFKEDQI